MSISCHFVILLYLCDDYCYVSTWRVFLEEVHVSKFGWDWSRYILGKADCSSSRDGPPPMAEGLERMKRPASRKKRDYWRLLLQQTPPGPRLSVPSALLESGACWPRCKKTRISIPYVYVSLHSSNPLLSIYIIYTFDIIATSPIGSVSPGNPDTTLMLS